MADDALAQVAWSYVEHTGINVFLTGKAGTGKTTFLKRVVAESNKTCVVVAPTGVAAINAGGVTIHSFFQLAPQPFVPGSRSGVKYNFSRRKLRIMRAMDLLIIDEISMVRSDMLDAVDECLRRVRRSNAPFGGVQVLMIGDLQQLTPVTTYEDDAVLSKYYTTPYFFGSRVLSQARYVTISLEHVYRQRDERFVQLLNHVRDNRVTEGDMALLQSRCQPDFEPRPEDGYIRIATHNYVADAYNERRMSQLPGAGMVYTAVVTGEFSENLYPTSSSLLLKVGAQVMFIRNDTSGAHRYYNGKLGVVAELQQEYVKVMCSDSSEPVTVSREEWENVRYSVGVEAENLSTEVIGVFSQMPLRPAWAITVHKSQGLTFDRAVIDAGKAFAPGQVYVALSRCRSLEGLVLATPLGRNAIFMDEGVGKYLREQSAAMATDVVRLDAYKMEYARGLMVELFDFVDIARQIEHLAVLLETRGDMILQRESQVWRDALTRMAGEVSGVAHDWVSQLGRMDDATLWSSTVVERVCRACDYFKTRMADIMSGFDKTVRLTAMAPKSLKSLVADVLENIKMTFEVKVSLLERFSHESFSVDAYMKAKRRGILEGAEDDVVRRRRLPGKNRSGKREKPKAERIASRDKTAELWRGGMRVDEIVAARGLVESTIVNHLMATLEVTYGLVCEIYGACDVKLVRDALAQQDGLTRAALYDRDLKGRMEVNRFYHICMALGKIKGDSEAE